jgi:fucose permease
MTEKKKHSDLSLPPQTTQQSYAITWDDKQNIIISILSFIGFICYGYFACALGASIPLIAKKLNIDETDLGILFTARGIGFMAGTVAYTLYVTFKCSYFKNEYLVSWSVAIAGLGASVLLVTTRLWVLMCVVFIQGFVFAGIDIIANILLPSIWKGRVQPWLQTLHACWSVGGIVGPALIGSVGYHGSNLTLMILSFIPLALLALSEMIELSNRQPSGGTLGNSLKSFKYKLKLGEVLTSRGRRSQKQSPAGEGAVPSGDDEEEEGEEDDDDDAGIQIRPLQENKVTSSNYVSASAVSGSRAERGGGGFEFDYYSHSAGEEVSYEGDEEGEAPHSPTLSPSSPSPPGSPAVETSPPSSPTTVAGAEDYWTLSPSLRVCLFLFYFIYVGLETGYGGWIPTYAIERSIAKNDAEGAYLASIFFFAISAGRLAAIPLASFYTPNFLLRVQLSIVIVGMVLVVTIGTGQVGYSGLAIATAVLGYGVSCIFPLGLSVTQDFNKLLMSVPLSLLSHSFSLPHMRSLISLPPLGTRDQSPSV